MAKHFKHNFDPSDRLTVKWPTRGSETKSWERKVSLVGSDDVLSLHGTPMVCFYEGDSMQWKIKPEEMEHIIEWWSGISKGGR